MLTAVAVSDVLRTAFPRARVAEVLAAMTSQGIVERGPTTVFSPHNAVVAALACALPEASAAKALSGAMLARDWQARGLAPDRKLAAAVQIEDLRDIRLIRALCAQVYTRWPNAWSVRLDEAVGLGLRFWSGGGERLLYRERDWTQIPQCVIEGFARHNGLVSESQRRPNVELLAKIGRSLRIGGDSVMTGAERSRRHRETKKTPVNLVEPEAEREAAE